jgi:predicted permease
MNAVVEALAPVFLLVVLGWGLRRAAFVPDGFWPPAERLTYYVLFPALLVSSTAKADLSEIDAFAIGGALSGTILAMSAAVLALRRAIGGGDPAFTSVFQGSVRVNTYVGLAAGASLYGGPATAVTAVCVLAVVPLVNLVSVLVMTRFGEGGARGARAAAVGVATNPLILAVVAGAALNLAGVHRIPVATPLMDVLGAASLPLGLLAVGAGLDLPAARRGSSGLAWACALKLGVQPAVAFALCSLAGVEGLPLAVAVLYAGLPTSASSYVMARQMGGDAELMAGIVTVQTLLAALTMPATLALVAAAGVHG